ncbi:hypothetical protein H9P43_008296 [Blastocladiella emersonii ATCC 22665]|nr:hypothetical protein H9P43_008296 [Blastocladiella emersonii ATCC 22665]
MNATDLPPFEQSPDLLTDDDVSKWQARFLEDSKLDSRALSALRDSVKQLSKQLRFDTNVIDSAPTSPSKGAASDASLSRRGSQAGRSLAGDESDVNGDTFITATGLTESQSRTGPVGLHQSLSELEATEFPGYVHGNTVPLPTGIDLSLVAQTTLDHHELPVSTRTRFLAYMKNKNTQFIANDLFWWFFLDRFKKPRDGTAAAADHDAQKKQLFTRVARKYVDLFLHIKPHDRDEFTKVFPDVISETIYHAFAMAFPDSHDLIMTTELQTALTDMVHEWMTGVRPYERKWTKWEYQEMAETLGKLEANQLETGTESSSKGSTQRLSHYIGPLPPVTRIPFDMYSNSPIVQHYLTTSGCHAQNRKISVIHFHRVARESDEQTSRPTYHDLVHDSARTARRGLRKYHAAADAHARERAKLTTDMVAAVRAEERDMQRTLQRPDDVKEACTAFLGWDRAMRDLESLPAIPVPTSRRKVGAATAGAGGGRTGGGSNRRYTEPARVYRRVQVVDIDEDKINRSAVKPAALDRIIS